jgi:RNA polymerase sigma factor (TIGR02999 family)
MPDVTRLIEAAAGGDPKAAADLLPLVYDELRKLAAGHLAREKPVHTLDATALVHEAYVRLVGPAGSREFASRRHFFAAAAEAMRRILVDHARRRQAAKRGGAAAGVRVDLERLSTSEGSPDSWIDLDQVLTAFASVDAGAAELAKLRIFGGLSLEEAAEALEMPRATAFRTWTYARAWLTAALADESEDS